MTLSAINEGGFEVEALKAAGMEEVRTRGK